MSTSILTSAAVAVSPPQVPLWVNGKRSPSTSQRYGDVTNAATGLVVRTVPLANAGDIDDAVRAAVAAFPACRATTPLRRARILSPFRDLMERHQKDLAALTSEEHGGCFSTPGAGSAWHRGHHPRSAPPPAQGRACGIRGSRVDAYSRLQPVGVCAGITPFNFVMVLMGCSRRAVCGNTFILAVEKDPSAAASRWPSFTEAGT